MALTLRPIPKARNPGGFDFANYMKKKGVYLQLHSDNSRLTFIDKTPSLRGNEQLLQHVDKLEIVLQALVLGDFHLQEEYAQVLFIFLQFQGYMWE